MTGVEQESLRIFLLEGLLRFSLTVGGMPGVSRIALVGSLVTQKVLPKDADVLVTVAPEAGLDELAKAGRKLKGYAQGRNSGADIFLADPGDRYIGRICHWRECMPGIRRSCRAGHCGQRKFLSDDLQIVSLSSTLVIEPPVELWPEVVRRVLVPADVERTLLKPLESRRQRAK